MTVLLQSEYLEQADPEFQLVVGCQGFDQFRIEPMAFYRLAARAVIVRDHDELRLDVPDGSDDGTPWALS